MSRRERNLEEMYECFDKLRTEGATDKEAFMLVTDSIYGFNEGLRRKVTRLTRALEKERNYITSQLLGKLIKEESK